MEKLLRSLTIAVLVLGLSLAVFSLTQAEQSGTVTIKVTIAPSISVSLSEDAVSLGSLAAGATAVSTTPITITNNGSGINQTYSLSLTNPSGWTASQVSAGVEEFALNAAFSDSATTITWDTAEHALSTAPVSATSAKFAGNQTGINVPYNATRKLWFQFKAPTATTVNTEQSIVVTITAEAS